MELYHLLYTSFNENMLNSNSSDNFLVLMLIKNSTLRVWKQKKTLLETMQSWM